MTVGSDFPHKKKGCRCKKNKTQSSMSYTLPFEAALAVSQTRCVLRTLVVGDPTSSSRNSARTLGGADEDATCLKKLAAKYGLDQISVFNTSSVIVASTDAAAVGVNVSSRVYAQTTLRGEGVQEALLNAVAPFVHYVVTTSPVFGASGSVLGGVATFKQIGGSTKAAFAGDGDKRKTK